MAAGSLAFGQGDHEQCERYAEDCLEPSRQTGDKLRVVWARAGLGVAAMSRTDYEVATPTSYFGEALRSFREVNDDYGVALATTFLVRWR